MEQRGFGDLEAVVMDCVWDYAEPVTVREVFDEISQRRQIAYTTVMSTMDNLYRKRWLKRQRDGKAYLYQASMSREERSARLMKAAFDAGGRVAVIRLLSRAVAFDSHICRGTLSVAEKRSPLFRSVRKNGNLSATPLSGAAVHATIRRRATHAGYDPDTVAQLGGHSLRAGFVTQAFRNGADAHAIMRQTEHTTPGMVEIYARENAPLIGNAVNDLGL
mgnify:CR=1 FL=1